MIDKLDLNYMEKIENRENKIQIKWVKGKNVRKIDIHREMKKKMKEIEKNILKRERKKGRIKERENKIDILQREEIGGKMIERHETYKQCTINYGHTVL